MIKYSETDISDGIKYLNIGIGNIISSLYRGEINEFIVNTPLDYLLVVSSLRNLYSEECITYSDKLIQLKITNQEISIIFDNNKVIFKI